MPKKMLIIGGSGFIGGALANYASNSHELHLTNLTHYTKNYPSTKIDLIKDPNSICNLIESFSPDITIHAVAYPNVDYCETNPQAANFLHIEVSKIIADICKKINSKLIYFSTDAVFDGKLVGKYSETDKTNPLSHYGKTKLEAEKIILNSSYLNVILRTTVVYGNSPQSRFTSWIIDNLLHKKSIHAFTDQFNTPTLVNDLVTSVLKIIQNDVSGMFHAVGTTCLSRYDFAMKLAQKLNLDTKLIIPSTSKNQLAPRSLNGCLNPSKLEKIINYKFSNIDDGISTITRSL